jgi:hypothetical protein
MKRDAAGGIERRSATAENALSESPPLPSAVKVGEVFDIGGPATAQSAVRLFQPLQTPQINLLSCEIVLLTVSNLSGEF